MDDAATLLVVVEEEPHLPGSLTLMLKDAGYEAASFPTPDLALDRLEKGLTADLVVTDLSAPGMAAGEFIARLRRKRPELEVITVAESRSVEAAIRLVKAGAHDYIARSGVATQLLPRVDRALIESLARRELSHLTREPGPTLPGLLGPSPPMQRVFAVVRQSAESPNGVLITGETGTGKELVARAIHVLSGLQKFVAVNCGALPPSLLESELFGHMRGAFTGAERGSEGLFEAAHNGTLFLDELSELNPALQPKLLRALDDGEVRRVGSTRSRRVDVRIIAATNQDLESEVRAGRFREDLFWRVNVINIEVPPLRDRSTDIPLLAVQFLMDASERTGRPAPRISEDALEAMQRYSWPGNVRELRHAMERAVVLSSADEIGLEDLPPRVLELEGRKDQPSALSIGEPVTLEELEREHIMETLRRLGGNKSRAADLLGIDRKTLYRRLDTYREKK